MPVAFGLQRTSSLGRLHKDSNHSRRLADDEQPLAADQGFFGCLALQRRTQRRSHYLSFTSGSETVPYLDLGWVGQDTKKRGADRDDLDGYTGLESLRRLGHARSEVPDTNCDS